jgi:hypothetical protein
MFHAVRVSVEGIVIELAPSTTVPAQAPVGAHGTMAAAFLHWQSSGMRVMALAETAGPTAIQIDASAHCQLACPSCPTASGATLEAMSAGHLDPANFERLLEANPGLQEVELSNYGEMFLNPKLRELLRIAFEHKVVLHANNGTNLNHASEETLDALVKYRFRSLSVSIDGASQETYSRYRVKGDFERVIGNIEKINAFKRKHGSGFPMLTWQFIVFGHNEHEIETAKALAAKLGMSFRPKISWDDDISPIRDAKLVQIQTGLHATRKEHYQATGSEFARGICHQLWAAPVLNWDGRLLGCCRNFWGEFGGNAFESGLHPSLSASLIPAARQALMGKGPMDPAAPCSTCELYQTMERDGKWISQAEVERAIPKPTVLASIVVDPGDSPATHADVFLTPGHEVNRIFFVRPLPAQRFEIGVSYAVMGKVTPGKQTIYVLPKQLDPSFRKHYPPLPPVTMAIEVTARPLAQEFTIKL